MFDRASKKLGLDRAVLARIESAVAASSAENAKMMDRLLRHGAYALFQDADEADKFCEEDIDQILAQRARVLTEAAGERSSEFSKAHFQVNETEEQKDIEFMIESEDPELWNKLGIRDNSHEKSIIWTKRDRKQTKMFSAAIEEAGFASSSSDSDADDEKSSTNKYLTFFCNPFFVFSTKLLQVPPLAQRGQARHSPWACSFRLGPMGSHTRLQAFASMRA